MNSFTKFCFQLFLAAVITGAILGLIYAISLWPFIGVTLVIFGGIGILFCVVLAAVAFFT